MDRQAEHERRSAVYVPDNDDLWRLLEHLPSDLERYVDHARFLLHSIGAKRWLGDLDPWGWARLGSTILREYIPNRALKPLKDFLFEAGVLEMTRYTKGRRTTGYRIGRAFDGPPIRVLLTDPRLIRKRLAWRKSYGRTDDPALVHVIQQRHAVLEQMRVALSRLSLIHPVEVVVRELRGSSVNTDHVRFVCNVICHDDHDGLIVDPFGFRVHSIVTRTASVIRPFLRLDGQELTELDVANAQPLLLAAALRRPDICTSYVGLAHHIGRGQPDLPRRLVWCSKVPPAEVDLFSALCENGELYEFLQADGNFPDRKTVKRLLYRDVLFCKPRVRGAMTKVFARPFPGLFNAIITLKRTQGYKAVAMLLQRLESHIMIDCVCQRLVDEQPGLPFLTIHDSALVVVGQGETVCGLIVDEFARHGVRATVREKGPAGRYDAEKMNEWT